MNSLLCSRSLLGHGKSSDNPAENGIKLQAEVLLQVCASRFIRLIVGTHPIRRIQQLAYSSCTQIFHPPYIGHPLYREPAL